MAVVTDKCDSPTSSLLFSTDSFTGFMSQVNQNVNLKIILHLNTHKPQMLDFLCDSSSFDVKLIITDNLI